MIKSNISIFILDIDFMFPRVTHNISQTSSIALMNKSNIQLVSSRVRCGGKIFIPFGLAKGHPFLLFLLVPLDVVEFGGKETSYRRASDTDKDSVASII